MSEAEPSEEAEPAKTLKTRDPSACNPLVDIARQIDKTVETLDVAASSLDGNLLGMGEAELLETIGETRESLEELAEEARKKFGGIGCGEATSGKFRKVKA